MPKINLRPKFLGIVWRIDISLLVLLIMMMFFSFVGVVGNAIRGDIALALLFLFPALLGCAAIVSSFDAVFKD
jgi:hypothetical protein